MATKKMNRTAPFAHKIGRGLLALLLAGITTFSLVGGASPKTVAQEPTATPTAAPAINDCLQVGSTQINPVTGAQGWTTYDFEHPLSYDYEHDPRTLIASPDGRLIATRTHSLSLSNPATGEVDWIFTQQPGLLRWSPASDQLVYLDQHKLNLHTVNYSIDSPLSFPPDVQPRVFAWSPDGTRLAVVTADAVAYHGWIFNMQEYEVLVADFPLATTAGSLALSWSPRSDSLVVFGNSALLEFYSLESGELRSFATENTIQSMQVSWAPDGAYALAYYFGDEGLVQGDVFDAQGKLVWEALVMARDGDGSAIHAWAEPDRLVIEVWGGAPDGDSDSSLRVLLLAEQATVPILEQVDSWALAPDGALVATAGDVLVVYDHDLNPVLNMHFASEIAGAGWFNDSQTVYYLTEDKEAQTFTLVAYDLATESITQEFVIDIWGYYSHEPLTIKPVQCVPPAVAALPCLKGGFTADEYRYYVTIGDAVLPLDTRTWQTLNYDPTERFRVEYAHEGSKYKLLVVDTRDVIRIETASDTFDAVVFRWSPRAAVLAYLSKIPDDPDVLILNVFDVTMGVRQAYTIELPPSDQPPESDMRYGPPDLAWSPDGASVAVLLQPFESTTGHVQIYDVGESITLNTAFEVSVVPWAIHYLYWSPYAGRYLAITNKYDGFALIDRDTNSVFELDYDLSSSTMHAVTWSPQETYLVTLGTYSDFHSELKVFDLAKQTQTIPRLLINPVDDGAKGIFAWLNDHTILAMVKYDEDGNWFDYDALVDLRSGDRVRVGEINFGALMCME